MNQKRLSLFAMVLTTAALVSQPELTDGSLAIGLTPDGFSYGFAGNATKARAEALALADCRMEKRAAQYCKTVATFKNKCFAIAWDLEPGPGGLGWAVDADLATAERQAIAGCRATAKPGRSQYCKIDESNCDKS
ncbi:MAG TPA: DUF4189 domain-containing protein [Xanthobacteraceae bacterium]|jgi:hypothetical protein